MNVPASYLFALCCTLFVTVGIFTMKGPISVRSRNLWIGTVTVMALLLSGSWCNVFLEDIHTLWLRILLMVITTPTLALLFLAVTYEYVIPDKVSDSTNCGTRFDNNETR